MQRHCFTTRVWPNSDIPLHRGGIHIWSNLVFIHYWVLPKKLSILSIDTWGGNPFFHPLLVQAKFASGAFGAHGPALSGQFPGRGGGEGGGVGVKGPVPASPPWLTLPLGHLSKITEAPKHHVLLLYNASQTTSKDSAHCFWSMLPTCDFKWHIVSAFMCRRSCSKMYSITPPCASTPKARKTTVRQGPMLRQGSAHKRKPKGAVTMFQSQSKTRIFRHITVTDTVHVRKGIINAIETQVAALGGWAGPPTQYGRAGGPLGKY